MALADAIIASLNAGEISRYALARVDLAKAKIACEKQQNFLPDILGPARFRPGTAYLDHTKSDAAGRMLEFYYDATTKALLVLTANIMRIMLSGVYLTRPSVSAAITNGGFGSNVASWTDSDEAGAVSQWATGGYLSLQGTGDTYAFRDQQVVVTETGTEHALRLIVNHGTVRLQVGTAQGLGDYVDFELAEGWHSLAFTPSGDFWIRLGSRTEYPSYVDSIAVEGSGTVEITSPWGSSDLANIMYDQSGDVVFVAGGATVRQYRIERRASNSRSWGIAAYYSDDGPFRLGNTSDITLSPSATTGSVTITASRALFQSGHVGALFKLTHGAQAKTGALSALNAATGEIRVSGIGAARGFALAVDGTFTATISLQRSLGAPGSWSTVESYTTPTSKTFADGLDNQIVYYRLICTAYTSGTANVALAFNGSSQTGMCRLVTITDSTHATADVLAEFGSTDATSDWKEGEWSSYRGFPAAVALHDGRLFWQTGIKTHGSISDAFDSFDENVIGDAGAINRTVATGGADGGRWLLSLQRLLIGTAAQEISVRANAFDEPLTPTAFTARAAATRGVARVRAMRVDSIGVYAGRDAQRVYEIEFDVAKGDYVSRELTRLKQEMCAAGIKSVAVQRQSDTRVWFVLNDGTCAVLTYDKDQEVLAWTPVTTDGLGSFEDVAVLPGTDEDDVYFIVHRGSYRLVEKLAKRSECIGGTLNKTCDSHIVYAGAPTTTISGLGHLEGQSVVVWGDGAPVVKVDQPKRVIGGQIADLPVAVSNAVVGVYYTGWIKTAKLAIGAEHGTALTMQKRVARVGLVMADVAPEGILIGRSPSILTGLPKTYRGKALTSGQVLSAFDAVPGSFNGGWDSDARVCLTVDSPYPCTLMGLALQVTTNEPEDEEPKPRARGDGG